MRLSEIKGERVFEVIADLVDPIAEIAMDKEASDLFKSEAKPEGMEPWDFFLSKLRKSLPKLVRSHKHELCQILATINDVTADEYMQGVTMMSLISDLTELLTDREFTAFFG